MFLDLGALQEVPCQGQHVCSWVRCSTEGNADLSPNYLSVGMDGL